MTLQEESKKLQQKRQAWQGVPTQLPPEEPYQYDWAYSKPQQPEQVSQGLQQPPVNPPMAAQEPTYKGAYSDYATQPAEKKAEHPQPDTSAAEASGSYMDILRQYMPKPDYEQEKRNARRAQMGAFISDLANVVGKAGASLGGAWMIEPTQFRTPAAQAQYQDVLNREKAAYMDYGGKLATAAMKDLEAKTAADALAAKNAWERYKFGVGLEQDQRDFDYQKEKDKREYDLAVKKAEQAYKLGLITAEQKNRIINETITHNRNTESIGREANRIRAAREAAGGTNKGTTVYLKDKNGQIHEVNLTKNQANNVMGYLARNIKKRIGNDPAYSSDYSALMSQFSGSDSNTKLQAVVNMFGSEIPGLYEETTKLIGGVLDDDYEDDEDVL